MERHATPHEAVEIRRADVPITERPDRIGALVVGEKEEHVWPCGGLFSSGNKSTAEGAQQGDEKVECVHGWIGSG